jgi:hypothetical protein
VEGAFFPLNSYACISQCFQNQYYVLYILFIGFRIDKDVIEIGVYIDLGNPYAHYAHYNYIVSMVSVRPMLTIITPYS